MRSDVKSLRHSGHTQNPLRSAFPIIILGGKFISALELVFFADARSVLGVGLDRERHEIHHL